MISIANESSFYCFDDFKKLKELKQIKFTNSNFVLGIHQLIRNISIIITNYNYYITITKNSK